jgi:hypothetical protein
MSSSDREVHILPFMGFLRKLNRRYNNSRAPGSEIMKESIESIPNYFHAKLERLMESCVEVTHIAWMHKFGDVTDVWRRVL